MGAPREQLTNLRLLVTTGPGNAAIDVDAAADLGITVAATGSSLASTVELTWDLILATTRHLCEEDRAVRAGGWQHTIGPELHGATLGLVGLGNNDVVEDIEGWLQGKAVRLLTPAE